MKTTLSPEVLDPIVAALTRANSGHDAIFPGDSSERQPVHSVYGGAHLFKPETPAKLGALALDMLRTYTPDAASFAECLGLRDAAAGPRRSLSAPSPSCSASRWRTSASISRTATASARCRRRRPRRSAARRCAGGRQRRHAAAVRWHPHQVVHRSAARPSLRTLDLFLTALLNESGKLPAELRRHAAEDHRAAAGDRAGPTCSRCWRPWHRPAARLASRSS